MTAPGFLRHGGRMGEAAANFSDAPLPWIDLSTGINPHAWDGPRADIFALRRLPDASEILHLEAAAAGNFGADAAMVAAVPGAESALRLLPRVIGARSVAILSPTYGGHAEAWGNAGATILTPRTLDDLPPAGALVVVNPNNPDGRSYAPARLAALSGEQRVVIVDESFGEVTPEMSAAGLASDRLIVLRSFGKFYGLAGVRLGFVIAGPDIIKQVRAAFGDWPVSAEAIAAGTAAYADHGWAEATRARLGRDAARLDMLLEGAGLKILGGTDLFRLCTCASAEKWFEHLARHGILVRPFGGAGAENWLRFGLPGDERAWTRLENALQKMSHDR